MYTLSGWVSWYVNNNKAVTKKKKLSWFLEKITRKFLKNKRVVQSILPAIKTYYKPTKMKIAWYSNCCFFLWMSLIFRWDPYSLFSMSLPLSWLSFICCSFPSLEETPLGVHKKNNVGYFWGCLASVHYLFVTIAELTLCNS